MRPGGGLTTRRTLVAWGAAALAGAAAFGLTVSGPEPAPMLPAVPAAVGDLPDAPGTVGRGPAAERPRHPAAVLTPTAAGDGLLWSPRGTGVVRRAPVRDGRVGRSEVLARVPAAPGPAGGVRGLAVERGGRVFAAFVRVPDARLVVAEVSLPQPRLVWVGPRTGRTHLGGSLVALPGGRLALAVGDQASVRASQPGSLLGRVLTLDPDRPPSQEPRRRSRGWHDPALVRGRGRALWVADRAGGGDAERIGRADHPRAGTVRSGVRRAPVALAAADGGRVLLVCGLRSGRLDRTLVRGGGTGSARSEPQILEARCRYGVAVVGRTVLVSNDAGRIRRAGTVGALTEAPPLPR